MTSATRQAQPAPDNLAQGGERPYRDESSRRTPVSMSTTTTARRLPPPAVRALSWSGPGGAL
ncbi:hypothetical protein [Streptomyces sp. NK08204]|uniref:hypothetical protein n=1 Tax=Streptomyces sp. NK08204 TaxID=2873260 RepID=UPI001CEC0E8F|nr:hypothetical protein [Streptomyces sp. NK08204]